VKIEYPYERTTGPVVGAFLGALRDGRIVGNRCGDRVLVPPLEYDPDTAAPLDLDLVDVGPGGTVTSWTWIAEPTRKHPFQHPFAFALIKLDGADVPFVHAVDAGSIDAMSTGMRVAAQFLDVRAGAITDLYFVPEAAAIVQQITPGDEPVTMTTHLISLEVDEPLAPHRERFRAGLQQGKIIGQRSPTSGKVYVPSRGYDAMERVQMTEADDVVCSDRGAISSYTLITPVDYYGQEETVPYVRASILLDGTDSPIIGVDIRGDEMEGVRVGMRVQAIWRPPAERSTDDMDNRWGGAWEAVIERWEPTGEPDDDPRPLQQYAF
jgi:uncharacterized OB-fold protein